MGAHRDIWRMQHLRDGVREREAKRAKADAFDEALTKKNKEEIPKELNADQATIYSELVDFLKFDHEGKMLLLEGYAGTGKTYLIGKFIEYIFKARENFPIAMTAPTNKAVKVLRRASQIDNQSVNFSTIHSLLGLREQITENGDQIFVSGFSDTPNISNYKLLIIDEVSMLPDDLFKKIQEYANDIKIIMLGDPCQIPPVMRHDCIPFTIKGREDYKIQLFQLKEIMRQKKGNSIIENSFIIRQNLSLPCPPIKRVTALNEDGKGVVHINSANETEREAFIETIGSYFKDEKFKSNSDYAKVLSWTNKSVAQMNRLIRKMIYKDQQLTKIMIGEKLIANKPIIEINKLGKTILFTSNDEFEVISFEVLTDERFFFYYNTIVEETLINGYKNRKTIRILHEDSESEFNKKLAEIKKEAITETDVFKKKSAWRYFYDFLGIYADINYNYSITAHKSQGSSYQNTFVLEDDIDQNNKIIERNRIKYTAFTRASEKLFIIHKK